MKVTTIKEMGIAQTKVFMILLTRHTVTILLLPTTVERDLEPTESQQRKRKKLKIQTLNQTTVLMMRMNSKRETAKEEWTNQNAVLVS